MEKIRIELLNTKRQCDLLKKLLQDATDEKEIMYDVSSPDQFVVPCRNRPFQAFNEELDAMYQDANLPKDEAWVSMSKDLQGAKEARNLLRKENS